MKYPGIIYKEDNCYWIDFPDLKGCHTQGSTVEELIEYAKEAVVLYLEDAVVLPEPSKLEGDNIIYIDFEEAEKEAEEKEKTYTKEWILLREKGLTFQAIADKYNVSKQYVSDVLDRAGVKRKTKWSWAYMDWEELYKNGISIDKIGEKYNCPKMTILKHLRKKIIINRAESARKRWAKKKAHVNI